MSNGKTAHSKGSAEASTQAFLACMFSPRHLPLLTLEARHYLPSRSQTRWKVQETPKQGRVSSITLHTFEMQEPGLEARKTPGMLW